MDKVQEIGDSISTNELAEMYSDFSSVPEDATLKDIVKLMDLSEDKLKAFRNNTYQKSGKRKGPSESFIFPTKLYDILSSQDLSDAIAWLPHGRSWRILNKKSFEMILQKYFNHSNISSFVRQVNGWGFRRIRIGPDKHSYYNELFLRGKKHMIQFISRDSLSKSKTQEPVFGDFPPLPQENNEKTQKMKTKTDDSYLKTPQVSANALSSISHPYYDRNMLPCVMPAAIPSHAPPFCGVFPGYGQPYTHQELQGHAPFPYHHNETQSCDSKHLPHQQNSEHFQDGNCEQGSQLHMHGRPLVRYRSTYGLRQSSLNTDPYEIHHSLPPHKKYHQHTCSSSELRTSNNQESRYYADHQKVETLPIETAKISHAGEKPHYSLSKMQKNSKGTKQISSDVEEDSVHSCLNYRTDVDWSTSCTPSSPSALTHKSHNQQPKSMLPSNISSEAKHESRMDSIPDFSDIHPAPYIETQQKYSFDEWWQEFCYLFSEN